MSESSKGTSTDFAVLLERVISRGTASGLPDLVDYLLSIFHVIRQLLLEIGFESEEVYSTDRYCVQAGLI
jgi:hypothetical protein